jgi:hypothetical protein
MQQQLLLWLLLALGSGDAITDSSGGAHQKRQHQKQQKWPAVVAQQFQQGYQVACRRGRRYRAVPCDAAVAVVC